MKKYSYLFKLNILTALNYRMDSIFGLFMGNLGVVITIVFWMVIFKAEGGQIIVYSTNDIITYFVVSALLAKLTLSGVGFGLSGLIKGGGLSRLLLKPMKIPLHLYFENLAQASGNFISQLVITLLALPFIYMYITWEFELFSSILLFVYIIIATIISFEIWILFGKIAFWIQQSTSVMYSFAVILNFLTGMFIPLDFFPDWSLRVLEILPFSAFTYIPAKIFMGHYEPTKILMLIVIHSSWIVIFRLLNSVVWTRGLKKYIAVGG